MTTNSALSPPGRGSSSSRHTARWTDVRVLEAIFLKLMTEATRGQVTLPMSANTAAARQPWGERAPAVTAAWAPVGAWTEGQPLVQGMKFVITGGTRTPRDELYLTGIAAGLTPMNSVSSRTSFLVCNDPALATWKAIAAGGLASAVITEDRFRALLQSVQPGTPIGARSVVRVTTTSAPAGRLKGCRVRSAGCPVSLLDMTRCQTDLAICRGQE